MHESKNQVLVVDGDVDILNDFQKLLGKTYDLKTIAGGKAALKWLDDNPHTAVVFSCLHMLDMDGNEFLRLVNDRAPMSSRILMTGDRSIDNVKKAINEGNIFMYLTKPLSDDEIQTAARSGVAHHTRMVRDRGTVEKTISGAVKLLIDMLSLFHTEAFRKTTVLRTQAIRIARALGIKKTWELEMAVMLSPLGEALMPREILSRYRSAKTLTDEQRELLARAPEQSRDLLKNIPQLDKIADILYYSGRGYDGSGFPKDGPVGSAIPLNSRILKILTDLWYASPDTGVDLAAFEALNINGRQYDPKLLAKIRTVLLSHEEQDGKYQTVACHIRALHPGDILIDDILTDGGRELVLSRGHQLSDTTIRRLVQFDRVSGLRQPIRVRRLELDEEKPVEPGSRPERIPA